MSWPSTDQLQGKKYTCFYCDCFVAPTRGYRRKEGNNFTGTIGICPNCDNATYFDGHNEQFPGPMLGVPVSGITDQEVEQMYSEARACASVRAYTACVMACRKILMNVAVHQKADEGKPFVYYVDFLDQNGYIPPNGRGWLDEIRKRGNMATHEIKLMQKDDAILVLKFTAALLRFVYELPSELPKQKPST